MGGQRDKGAKLKIAVATDSLAGFTRATVTRIEEKNNCKILTIKQRVVKIKKNKIHMKKVQKSKYLCELILLSSPEK